MEKMEKFDYSFSLKCYPMSFIEKFKNNRGDKILLPPSILETISTMHISWPLIFEIMHTISGKKTHCGVLEFTSDEGCVYMPYWMMQNLAVKEGEKVCFRYVNLEKGNYIRFQPQTSDFLRISNPKAVLEAKLRNFTCLTKTDTIAIDYNETIFWLNVLEVKPGHAISLLEADINVDFSPPMCDTTKKKKKAEAVSDNNQFRPLSSSSASSSPSHPFFPGSSKGNPCTTKMAAEEQDASTEETSL